MNPAELLLFCFVSTMSWRKSSVALFCGHSFTLHCTEKFLNENVFKVQKNKFTQIITPASVFTFVFIPFLLVVWVGCGQHERTSGLADSVLQTPLKKLLEGNNHFAHLKPVHPDEDLRRLQDAAKEQHPFAVIVCCSDSRVSPELIFDQGIGDLFVIRTAGNIIGGIEIGSIEYAVEHLKVNLVVVMGHENCGAIKAFVEGTEVPGHIKDIVDSIKKESEIEAIPLDDNNRLDDCVIANILHGVKQLQVQSAIIQGKLQKNELEILGARYDLDDFKVEFLKQ